MFTPTPEQDAITTAARETTDNLAVIARAGAAKTSTLILIAEALPDTKILCLAFNKKIAVEMTERLPKNCDSKTLHGLGYGVWRQFIGKKCELKDRKLYQLLRKEIDGLEKEARDEAFERMAETLDFIKKGKAAGWLPEDYSGHWKPLMDDDTFYLSLPMEPSELQWTLIKRVSRASFEMALAGQIDFDDMVMCPALCSVTWPSYPLTMVDEAQDLSTLNHHIIKKIVRNKRLIAVGDPLQAIYGFRGADSNSMERLQKKFDMMPYYLTISFRCARSITENARWLADDMRYPEWAEAGEVHKEYGFWSADDIEDEDAIICRNNAPLFRMAMQLIAQDRIPELVGRDIAMAVLKQMKKLGNSELRSPAAIESVNAWEAKELKRARTGAKSSITDRAEIMRMMLERNSTLGNAIFYFEDLMAKRGRIKLMTGHKSKGLEFNRVWFLDQHYCVIDRDQDANIKYVIETRAKKFLAYVYTSEFS